MKLLRNESIHRTAKSRGASAMKKYGTHMVETIFTLMQEIQRAIQQLKAQESKNLIDRATGPLLLGAGDRFTKYLFEDLNSCKGVAMTK